MPTTDPLVHLPVHNFSHMGHVIVVDGCLDVGTATKYHLTPIRLNLRCECPEKDLDTIIDTLSKNREALKAKIRASAPVQTAAKIAPKPVTPPPVRTGPRKKFA